MSAKNDKAPRKELDPETRDKIIEMFLADLPRREIIERTGIAKSTVYETITRYKTSGSAHPVKRPGRPRKNSTRGRSDS